MIRGLLNILLRYRLAGFLACLLAALPAGPPPLPYQAMHYPRKTEDLMEAVSTLGEPLHPGGGGEQSNAPWFLSPP